VNESSQFNQYFNRRKQMLSVANRWSFLLLIGVLLGCNPSKVLVKGKLQRVIGNQMPSPDLPSEEASGFVGYVFFFEPTSINAGSPTGEQGVFLMSDKTLVAKTLANKQGQFKVKLKPGKYSVLIGKESQFYSNISNLDGLINPVVVEKKNNKPLVLKADWGAIY